MKSLSRIVILLGSASFFADIASEAIYPLLPIFITQVVGASVLFLGVVEGVAEAVSALLKVFSGYLSDRSKNSTAFVVWGYLISTCRSLMGIAQSAGHIFFIRFADRVGKGVRSAPRDAWLSRQSSAENRGYVFGFHRGMDHLGATVAPLLAGAFLYFYPSDYRTLFLLTAIPGVISVALVFQAARLSRISEKADGLLQDSKVTDQIQWREVLKLPNTFWIFLGVIFVFGLGCAADSFLLLRLENFGFEIVHLPWLWAGLNFVKAASSFIGGYLSDRIGALRCTQIGWLLYAVTYLVFSFSDSVLLVLSTFFVYGIFFGLTEAPEKSLVSRLAPQRLQATAFGLYHLTMGISLLPANILFGYLWYSQGSEFAFSLAAALAVLAFILSYFIQDSTASLAQKSTG